MSAPQQRQRSTQPRAIQQPVNSITRAAPMSVNRPRLSDFAQLKEEDEQLLRLLNEKSAQLEDATITIIQLESTVESKTTQICELQHALEKCATEVSEFETLGEEVLETLESIASELEDAKITITQLISTVESMSTEICQLQHALEKSVTDVSEFETLSEEVIGTLEFKASQLEDAKITIISWN